MTCGRKHTLFQPTDEQWVCPICGAESGDFAIDSDDLDSECPLLHTDDSVVCFKCGNEWSGSQISKILKKKYHVGLVKCPHCNGAGWIKEEK